MIVDLDRKRSPAQQELVRAYYQGYIPHVVVLNAAGKAVYNNAGEVSESDISAILDRMLKDSGQ